MFSRAIFAAAALAGALFAAPAGAETKIFIIANQADGYGVDRCLANGERCGTLVATAYCKSQAFAEAKSFRKVDREEITGAVPTQSNNACKGGACEEFVAIECGR
jgi:hypothetical protein